jgi:hypothetical protein
LRAADCWRVDGPGEGVAVAPATDRYPTPIEAALIAQEVGKSADTVAIYQHFIYHFGWNSQTEKGT